MTRTFVLLLVLALAVVAGAAPRHRHRQHFHRRHHARRLHAHRRRRRRAVGQRVLFKAHHFADSGHPIRYSEFKVGRAWYSAVIANVSDPMVEASTVLAPHVSSVWGLVRTRHACAAVTGTFFAPRSGYPVGDIVVDGTMKAQGRRGSALAIDYYGRPHVFDTAYGKRVDWTSYRWGLRGTVRLLRNGRASVDPKGQRFHDARIWSRVARTGAGVTKSGKLAFVATRYPVTLTEFAKAMAKLGVRDAVNLDGGSSTCLVYRGVVVIRPARRLSNMVLLSETGAG